MPKVSVTPPNNTHPLLIVSGPTATGKTALALHLAKRFDGELVSADSRQIYRELTVLSGKDTEPGDTPEARSTVSYRDRQYRLVTYRIGGIPVWMYDAVSVGEEFSISQYRVLARAAISDIRIRGKLPIVVGGTGLYIHAIVSPPSTIDIPPDRNARSKWEALSVSQLQEELSDVDPDRFSIMNNSDHVNPRRLIRALEIARWGKTHPKEDRTDAGEDTVFWIGLRPDMDALKGHIRNRVKTRWNGGALAEAEALRNTQKQGRGDTALGLSQIASYLDHACTQVEAREAWTRAEFAYARRQMVWFRKQPGIVWYDAGLTDLALRVEEDVAAWYTQ